MERASRISRRRRSGLLLAAVLATAGTITAVGVTGAAAATIDSDTWYQIVSRHSGKAIDVCGQSTADRACIQQHTLAGQANQQFQFVSSGSGYHRLRARHSGKIIEVLDSSAADGAQLIQSPDRNGTNQQFRVVDTGSGHVKLINRSSGKAVDLWDWSSVNGARISQHSDTGGANQQWKLVKVGGGGGESTPPPGGGSAPPPPPPPGGGSTPDLAPPLPRGGTPSGNWPSKTGDVQVNGTISVPKNGLDGGMKRYCCVGDGGQEESQDPMFELADGAVLKNVIIGSPAGDGVHCKGRCTLENVWWEDVGEDAATFRATNGDSHVIGGGARNAADKTFQHNGSGTVHISGFYAKNVGKLYRGCGNCSTSHQRHVRIDNVVLDGAKYVAGINSNWGDTATLRNVTLINGRNTHVCAKYKGVPKGSEPSYLGDGINDANCRFTAADITYR